jgi:hypothetical protein
MIDHENVIPIDNDRVKDLGDAILGQILVFQERRRNNEVSISTANAEVIDALISVLAFKVASIDCTGCRNRFATQARKYISSALRDAAKNPLQPDAGGHFH